MQAGGAQDDPKATGMAHYLEHMLANKGTRKLGTKDFEAEKPLLDEIRATYDALFDTTDPAEREALYARIDELGQQANEFTIANELKQAFGVLGGRGFNAFTSRDQTAYVVDIPSNKLEPWAVLEGDRFTSPVFRSFQTEVETVYEEKNRAMDNAQRQMYDAMSAALFKDHPYGRSVLGTIEHLKNPSISRMEAFYDKWYVPGNMAVVLAGDFDSDEALQLIETHLGSLEPQEVPDERPPAVEPLVGEVAITVQHNADEELQLAWQTVARNHPDAAALTLADMLLDNSSSGILDRNLNNTEKVRSSGSSLRRDAVCRLSKSVGTSACWSGTLGGQGALA